ncbi:MAG: hypothetical protein ACE5K8_05840 [Candidatus Zixiibacteriota bacterium]
MLNSSEKAYCEALLALQRKDYQAASVHFDTAAPYFKDNREFNLFHETTKLMLAVKEERQRLNSQDQIEIKEVYSHG